MKKATYVTTAVLWYIDGLCIWLCLCGENFKKTVQEIIYHIVFPAVIESMSCFFEFKTLLVEYADCGSDLVSREFHFESGFICLH